MMKKNGNERTKKRENVSRMKAKVNMTMIAVSTASSKSTK